MNLFLLLKRCRSFNRAVSQFFISLFLLTFILSCATGKKEAPPSPPTAKNELHAAQKDLQAGQTKRALARLRAIIQKYPDSSAANEAHFSLGQIYAQMGDHANSYRSYISIVDSPYRSAREGDAVVGAAEALQRLGRRDESFSLVQRALRRNDLSTQGLLRAHELRFSLSQNLNDISSQLFSLGYLALNAPTEKRAQYLSLGSTLIENFSATDLERVLGRAELAAFHPMSQERLVKLQAHRRVDPLTVGAVLPLSGRQSVIATKTLRGLQLGLGIVGRNTSNIKLAIADSEGHPDGARRAVDRLIAEDHVIALVGDILSRNAEVVALRSQELGVPNISLSQRAGLTQVGPFIFRNAVTSEAQIDSLLNIAMGQEGLRQFAILYPNDAYGVEYANIFWDKVLARGGQIVAVQTYAPDERDFAPVVRRLVGTFYLEDRSEEYSYLLREWFSKQRSITARTESPDDLLPPIIRFDGLFIPDNTRALGQIASMLIYQNVPPVRLLGTNLWNNRETLERGTRFINNSLFVDIGTSQISTQSNFYKEYFSVFAEAPSTFEAQGYEAGLALRKALASQPRSRLDLRDRLSSVGSLEGSNGVAIQFNSQRELTRPLEVLTVENNQIVPVPRR